MKIYKFIPNADHDIFDNDFVLNNFSSIHPNYITLVGIISNFLVIYYLNQKKIYYSIFFLMLRCVCDILDGLVARKYDKTTNLGGYLDTLGDCLITTLYFYLFIKCNLKVNYNDSLRYTVIYFFFHMFTMNNLGSLYHHDDLKKKKKDFFKICIFAIIKNTILVHILFAIYNAYIVDKCEILN